MNLRVWQIVTPLQPLEYFTVPDLPTAAFLMDLLSKKTSTVGLFIFKNNEWCDWSGEDSEDPEDEDCRTFNYDLMDKYLSKFMVVHSSEDN
jgi:hypothetical protein